MRSNLFAAALATAALGAAVLATAAAAAEYTVTQCDQRHEGYDDASFVRNNPTDYTHRKRCGESVGTRALEVHNISKARAGRRGAVIWSAPAGTELAAVRVAANLRRDAGHRARLGFIDAAGTELTRIASGRDEPGGFEVYSRRPTRRGIAGFQAELVCGDAEGCVRSEQARTWVRNLRLTLRDDLAPEVSPGGDLLAGGWVRGVRSLQAALADRGSGVRRFELRVGGRTTGPTQTFRCAVVAGTGLASAMRPCALSRSVSAQLDTGSAPFGDGVNAVELCARDFGPTANESCERHQVRVDNSPPNAAFRRPDRRDPELIEAAVSDPHSGVAAAEIAYQPLTGGRWRELDATVAGGRARVRIDSAAEPSGRYRFRLRASDRAGNPTETVRRGDGTRMVLRFPLRERSRISARLRPRRGKQPFGSRPLVRGRLRGKRRPLARERVEVVERFAAGSRRRQRVSAVRTDSRGRYRARLGAGPSRRVRVRYPGSRMHLPAVSPTKRVAIRGSARLGISRRRVPAGERVGFTGRVRTRGAVVPARGKLVELQVRERGSRRFRTVRQALHTDRRGRIRMGYSFNRFYRRPVRFQFRLRVTPQAGWPYSAPAHSRPRSLTVVPR
jgi:hypothetical protein